MPKARLTSAFSSVSLALLCSLAGAQPAGDVVKVADRDVTIAWPSPFFQAGSANGVSWRMQPGGLGPQTDFPGGWSEIQAKWKALPAATGSPYKVLVVVPRQTARLTTQPDRMAMARSMITGVETDDIYQALALYKVALEVMAGGATRVEFEVQPDDDIGYAIDGVDALQGEVTRFARVRASHTPVTVAGNKSPAGYQFAIVVYDSRQALALPNSLNTIPTVGVPFRLFSPDSSAPALATWLVDSWGKRLSAGWPSEFASTPALHVGDWIGFASHGPIFDPDRRSPFAFEYPVAPFQPNAVPTSAPQPPVLTAWGDYKAEGAGTIKISTGQRWHNRGRVVVAKLGAVPSGAKSLSVGVTLTGPDIFDFVLRKVDGTEVARWPVATKPHPQAPLYLATATETKLNFPVGAAEDTVLYVEESAISREFGRPGGEESVLTVSSPAFSADAPAQPAPPADAPKGTKEGLASNDHAVQTASARLYWTAKDPAVEPALLSVAKSGSVDAVYAACEALARQDSPTAVAALKKVVVDGPFETNRYIALRALVQHGIKVTTADLWRTLGSNSWRARALSTVLAAQSDSKEKNVVVATMLIDVEPAVREVVAEVADANDESLSKRLLFVAFNDVSDSVRIAAARKLLTSKDARTRAETLKLVRDDSVFVATSVLQMLSSSTDPADLDAIRLALVDRRPLVQACALLTGAARQGDWTVDDVRPTFKSTDLRVQEALLKFAAAWPKAVPSDVLGKIASGNDAWLAERAKRIQGNG